MFKAEVKVINDDKWYNTNVRHSTKAEAEEYAKDLFQRWTQAVEWRVVKI